MSEGGCPFIGILSFISGKEKLAPLSGIEFSLLLPSLSNESCGRKEKGSFPDSIIGFKAPFLGIDGRNYDGFGMSG